MRVTHTPQTRCLPHAHIRLTRCTTAHPSRRHGVHRLALPASRSRRARPTAPPLLASCTPRCSSTGMPNTLFVTLPQRLAPPGPTWAGTPARRPLLRCPPPDVLLRDRPPVLEVRVVLEARDRTEPMVLVSYILDSHISILQTKFSYRERHEARCVGLEAVPLDQHIEGGHGERQPCLKILPYAVHDSLEMTDERQHGEHRLDEHTVLPLAALTQFEVGGIPLGSMESRVAQNNHALFERSNEPLKGIVCDIGRGTRPGHHQSPLVQQQTEFPPDNPAMIREAFAADLLGTAAFAHRVDQLDPVRVNDPEHSRGGQENLRPVLMGPEKAKEPRPLGEPGKQRPIVARQPAIERTIASAFERVQQPQGDDLAGP